MFDYQHRQIGDKKLELIGKWRSVMEADDVFDDVTIIFIISEKKLELIGHLISIDSIWLPSRQHRISYLEITVAD